MHWSDNRFVMNALFFLVGGPDGVWSSFHARHSIEHHAFIKSNCLVR